MRPDLDRASAVSLVEAIVEVRWGELEHAYGPADDVENQLIAVVVGDDETRAIAWWNLWGNIHHQGTIFTATVAALPIVARLASWRAFPDRVEALALLREIAAAPGVLELSEVDGEHVVAAAAQEERDDLIARLLPPVVDTWEHEPAEIRRALVWLLSALPRFDARYDALIGAVLPGSLRAAWALARAGPESQEDSDAICALEEWALTGSRGT